MPILDEFMSEEEVAEEISKSPRTLERWRALRKGPPFIRFGRDIFYHRPTFRDWLLSQQIDAQ